MSFQFAQKKSLNKFQNSGKRIQLKSNLQNSSLKNEVTGKIGYDNLTCSCGGSCPRCKNRFKIQAKLKVRQPNDIYEKEADWIAEKVMRMQDISLVGVSSGNNNVQRKCDACEKEEEEKDKIQMKPLATKITPIIKRQRERELDDEVEMVQKRAEGSISVATESFRSRLNASKGGGSPLPKSTNQFMSNSFGTDFSRVRIHNDSSAHQMNRDIQAKAFTHGSDIYFNRAYYSPETIGGKKLLAHELTHVVQQKGAENSIQREFALKPTNGGKKNIKDLGPDELKSAIKYNHRFKFSEDEIKNLLDLFGQKSSLSNVDELEKELSQRIAQYQVTYGITPNGKIDYETGELITLEIQKEDDFLKGKLNKTIKKVSSKIDKYYKFKTNTAVLYAGMHSYDKEIKKIRGALPFEKQGQLHTVEGKRVSPGLFDSEEDIKKLAKRIFPKSDAKRKQLIDLIKITSSSDRDELVTLIEEYNKAEKGYNKRMTRMIISGHSGGLTVFGEGSISLDTLPKLQQIFPKAAGQVQHLMVSACSAGTEDNINNAFVKAFPNLRTFWGYYGACPLAGGSHITEWLKMTKGDIHKLTKKAGGGVSIWNEGVYHGNDSVSKESALQQVTDKESTYQEYFKGDKIAKDPYSGDLYRYYNSLRGLLGRGDLTRNEKQKYSARRDQAVRLRFFTYVVKNFWSHFSSILKSGYGSANVPDFTSMNRKQVLNEIAAFDQKAKGQESDKKLAKEKLELCLKELHKSCIPESWLSH